MLQAKLKGAIMSKSVYRSVEQVLATLTRPEVFAFPEVRRVLSIGVNSDVIQEVNSRTYRPAPPPAVLQRSHESPFVVIEGLDGSGKTTLTNYVQKVLDMKLLVTPPDVMKVDNIRTFIDTQEQSIRRAYYSLGNYVAAKQVLASTSPVIMDRFWHSTAAYAVANVMRTESCSGDDGVGEEVDLSWPSDLLKPNLVIFLTVSEEERVRRHQSRHDFTNTVEEQRIATEVQFRANLAKYYRSISGVPFEEVSVDGSLEDSKASVLATLFRHFPALEKIQDK